MDAKKIIQKVTRIIELSDKPIIVGVSSRHVHLTRTHTDILFGKNYQLTVYRQLLQPGQFASNETVTIIGPKGKFENVRVVGPIRNYTQVEVSRTDAYVLGLEPPIRDSGDIKNSAPVKIIGPRGELDLKEGCIIAWRHIHFSPKDAEEFKVRDKEIVRIRAGSENERGVIFENVLCRVREDMTLECHLDIDEANACGIKTGDYVKMYV